MTGELWESDGVPPARDPRVTWYQRLPVDSLWKELSAPGNGNAALVTLKRPDLNRGYFNGVVLIPEKELQEIRLRLLEIPGVSQWDGPETAMPKMPDGRSYPAVVFRLENAKALQAVVELRGVEAVEPLFVAQDGIGCALETYTPNAADGDSFQNRIPWSYYHLHIDEAWNLYKQANNTIYDPGYPIRIGVIDTGVYEDEHQLTTVFTGGNAPRGPALNRTVVAKTWDDCGHGTRIAGLATAPLDFQLTQPRKIVGVAYGSNLTTVKYNSGVTAGAGSRVALISAINLAVGDGARVVNLALGMPYWSSFVYDNIATLYNTTQTIFVGAAGTFVKSVQFPAAMYPQVLAISIVKAKNKGDPQAGYELYGGLVPESAYGPEVAFASVNGDGDIPTTGGGQGLTTVGGSSSGTAHMSGIIALVWGKQPSATRAQVIARLRNSGSLKLISGEQALTPGQSQKVGYGIPDSYVAAGGSRRASISGPSMVLPGVSYTLSVTTDGWLPRTYAWNTGQLGASASFTAGQSGTANHSVIITNPIDNTSLTAQRAVTVGPTHKRILYSDPPIVRYPPYPFKGGTYDVTVNYGVVMPVGCAVQSALGQRLDYYSGAYHHWGPPLHDLSLASKHGFTIARPGGVSSRNLDVDARVWHSGTNAIRVKVHYLISEPDGVDCNMSGSTVHGWYPS